jgi:hypothetical protein
MCVTIGLLVSIQVRGEPVVGEYNRYVRGVDYDVSLGSWIGILRPSVPERPYDFDCYDSFTKFRAAKATASATAGSRSPPTRRRWPRWPRGFAPRADGFVRLLKQSG